ncbi:MAG TPA: hypothetical protein PKK31_03470 [Elusimicrobiales bacterium]|nr:hypothetical protein [Elusimicrobiales bacterium]
MMKKTSILIAMFAVMAAATTAKAQVDFDGRKNQQITIHTLLASDQYAPQTETLTPIPTIPSAESPEYPTVLRELDTQNRLTLAEDCPAHITGSVARNFLRDKTLTVLYNSREVVFVKYNGKNTYMELERSDDPGLLQYLDTLPALAWNGNKSWISVCKDVLVWVSLIKDGIEVGQWVTKRMCELEWSSGPGEIGHIPAGAETHVRAIAFQL